jgi:ubiquinone/menaquinone biosynthesis C-methylase UbiE
LDYKQWQEWWVTRAPEYFTDKSWKFSQPAMIALLGIEKHHCILELGFGYGREISQFCKLSDNVYGLELTDWACENTLVELTSRRVKPLPRLKSYDGKIFPFPTEAFHAIYNCFVIQHLSREHAKEIIKETLRVLKADGKALFEFFGDPQYYNNGEDVFSGEDGAGGMFNNAFIESEISDFIKSCGGEVIWLKNSPVTNDWGNHWVCFGRQK